VGSGQRLKTSGTKGHISGGAELYRERSAAAALIRTIDINKILEEMVN